MGKNLDLAIAAIEKNFGKGSIVKLDDTESIDVVRTSTGSITLDAAVGGGWPRGRIIEIYGAPSCGKSTLALHAAFEVQKENGMVAYIDTEYTFDKVYAEAIGIDTGGKSFILSQPTTAEEALTIIEELTKSNEVQLIILDSVAALVPKSELEGEMGESKMGLIARLMSQAMRKLTGIISKSNCTVLFLNQTRTKLGVMFGDPTTTTGGEALKFYSSIRCEVSRIGQNKDGEEVISNKTRVKVVKNKTFPPYRKAEFNIVFGEGVDNTSEVRDLAVLHEVIKKSGSWYSYGEVKLGQGEDNVKALLQDNPELFEEISIKVRELINSK